MVGTRSDVGCVSVVGWSPLAALVLVALLLSSVVRPVSFSIPPDLVRHGALPAGVLWHCFGLTRQARAILRMASRRCMCVFFLIVPVWLRWARPRCGCVGLPYASSVLRFAAAFSDAAGKNVGAIYGK